MDDSEIVCNQTENIDENIVNIERIEHEQIFGDENIVNIERIEHEQISENLDINHMEISSLRKYNSNVAIMPKLRSGRCSKSPPLPKVHDHLILKNRFRPIRPKQLVSTIVRHKSGLSPVMNITALPSNHLLISHPALIRETCTTNVSNKTNNCIKLNSSNNINNSDNSNINIINNDTINDNNNSNTLNILLETEESNIDKIVKTDNSNTTVSESHKNSMKLFFESMAQTVLNLPNEVQADIKMQICRLVSMAEIKYYRSRAEDLKIEN